MKFGFGAVLLIGTVAGSAVASDVAPLSPPTASQQEASLLITQITERYRYKPEGQASGIGARPFERFVKVLDPDRLIFTRAALAAMAAERAELDKPGDGKQLATAHAVFATYLARSAMLYAHAQDLLLRDMNFAGHERFQRARSNAAWEPDDNALRDLWRRRVMDDILKLRLAGSSQAHIVTTLRQRYERQLQNVRTMRSEEVVNTYLHAALLHLDPHGAYLAPPTTLAERARPGLVGVGMAVQQKGDFVTVFELPVGGPAERSGAIALGDRIVGITQDAGQPMTDVVGWRVDEVVGLLRGVAGSPVELDLLAQGAAPGSTPRRVVLTRARLKVADLRASGRLELVERGASSYRIGIVVVPTIYEDFAARKAGIKDYASVTRDVAATLETLKAQQADAILLDMRNNGGGTLDEAITLTGLFLPGVAVAQRIETQRGLTVAEAQAAAPAWDGPLAILIGQGSAAGTEVVAAAIQDYGRGLIIGDTSAGRGSIQSLVRLHEFRKNPASQLGDLRLTVGALCRAGGEPIQGHGVRPDVVVPGSLGASSADDATLLARPACRAQTIPKKAGLGELLPSLRTLHAQRMKTDLRYQKRLAQRAQELAQLASDEVSLNEAERRRTMEGEPQEDIAKFQLKHAVQVLTDSVELSGKR
ncbi:PDZ domain-containing protein [Massilia violaceinigra]|uniref:PDZ domain-containing protein n=1 Tax=Massilia violaceinigra TaxID=2045208 RepID=A0ABY4A3U9_9BURK|nr:S41 family peptidase [Massilia violaceinigra]UOD29062.1 PDZ domain-containing protein [Massilia violaceinigra]